MCLILVCCLAFVFVVFDFYWLWFGLDGGIWRGSDFNSANFGGLVFELSIGVCIAGLTVGFGLLDYELCLWGCIR